MPTRGVDYTRWEHLDDDDEEEDVSALAETTAAGELGRVLLSRWLREASPDILRAEVERTIAFIEAAAVTQPRAGATHADNRGRADAIVADLENTADRRHSPPLDPLIRAVAAASSRRLADLQPSERPTAARVAMSMHAALNTLLACQEHGARRLFERLRAAPDGPLARQYLGADFATAALDRHTTQEAASDKASLQALQSAAAVDGRKSKPRSWKLAIVLLSVCVLAAAAWAATGRGQSAFGQSIL